MENFLFFRLISSEVFFFLGKNLFLQVKRKNSLAKKLKDKIKSQKLRLLQFSQISLIYKINRYQINNNLVLKIILTIQSVLVNYVISNFCFFLKKLLIKVIVDLLEVQKTVNGVIINKY